MSRSPLLALATLARWREFQEKRASNAHQLAVSEGAKAREAHESACGILAHVQDRRLALLGEPSLDLSRMQLYAQIENGAQAKLAEKETDLHAAKMGIKHALGAYVNARAETRVVNTRLDRVRTSENERAEKRLFDQVSDLRQAGRKELP